MSPELTEGPYFVDAMLERSDIRSDPATGETVDGTPVGLNFRVLAVGIGGCTPLAGAVVDVWHCDALGVYSGVDDPALDTTGQQFLRGFQVTGEDGNAAFTTIFPGWYQGRAVHIHFKVRGTRPDGQSYEFTSQLFFEDDQADAIYADAPYASKGLPTLRNDGDGIYRESGGVTLVPLTETADGYEGTFPIGLNFG